MFLETTNNLRVAFLPYDLLMLLNGTFILGLVIKRTIFRYHTYQKGTDRLAPYALAYLPISIAFIYIFEELPVKFFLHDEFYENKTPQMSPQGFPIDEKRVFALGYNLIIWTLCVLVIVRHILRRRKSNEKTQNV